MQKMKYEEIFLIPSLNAKEIIPFHQILHLKSIANEMADWSQKVILLFNCRLYGIEKRIKTFRIANCLLHEPTYETSQTQRSFAPQERTSIQPGDGNFTSH